LREFIAYSIHDISLICVRINKRAAKSIGTRFKSSQTMLF
jgi:hypothetical protein